MAHYVVHVATPRSRKEAFDYMADLANFAEWDPGVERSEQVAGDGPALGAAYDVTVESIGRPLTLRYEIVEFEPSERFIARAESTLFTSVDTITVSDRAGDVVVTYDAELTLNGLLGLADPLLGLAFNRIGDRAAAGLVRALDGDKVAGPAS